MAEEESVKNQQPPFTDKLQPRRVFVSHTHADRKLAAHLKVLIEGAFSGMVKAFISSDPTPPGGIGPGDEWYTAIHEQLAASQAVWVLATPTSIEKPWIYWEAGIGKVSCPGALVVVCVGLTREQVPSPLSNFQAFDGLRPAEGGIGELVEKFGDQLGMEIPKVLIDSLAESWIAAAKDHKPEEEAATSDPKVSPEQLNRIEALLTRFEAASTAVRPSPQAEAPTTRGGRDLGDSHRERQRKALGNVLFEAHSTVLHDVERFIKLVDGAPEDAAFEFSEIDSDGDALVYAHRGGLIAPIFLAHDTLPDLALPADAPARTRSLVQAILKARDSAD